MLNFSNVFVAFVIFGISVGLPIKDEEIDELIYRLQDLKHQNLYDGEDYRKLENNDDGYSIGTGGNGGGSSTNGMRNIGSNNNGFHPSLNGLPQIVTRSVDQIGGGNLIRSIDMPRHVLRSFDSLGGGNMVRNLDHIGGAHLLKRTIDSIGGAHLLKRAVDPLGGGYLLK